MPHNEDSRERLQLLEAIVAGTNDAVLITETSPLDEPGPRITYVNDAFAKMTGYQAHEVLGRNPRFLQGPGTDAATTAQIRAALERGQPVRADLLNYRKDGTPFWVEISIFPVRNALGQLKAWAAIQRDVTVRKRAEHENARLHEQTEQAVRTRDEVLRIVAHDLRNPLSTISLSAGLLSTIADRAQQENQLRVIRRAVEGASVLIDDLLDAARMQSGAFSLNPEKHDVAALVVEAIEMQRAMAAKKNIRIDAQIGDGLPPINVDDHRMLQLFGNLIGNAVKFVPTGSTVTVRAARAGEEVLFSVTDTGPGIPGEQISHLFEPFWQASPRHRVGTGLGLTISKGIVEAHGGRMWVESDPGAQTTFYFTIPLALGPAQRMPDAA